MTDMSGTMSGLSAIDDTTVATSDESVKTVTDTNSEFTNGTAGDSTSTGSDISSVWSQAGESDLTDDTEPSDDDDEEEEDMAWGIASSAHSLHSATDQSTTEDHDDLTSLAPETEYPSMPSVPSHPSRHPSYNSQDDKVLSSGNPLKWKHRNFARNIQRTYGGRSEEVTDDSDESIGENSSDSDAGNRSYYYEKYLYS